MAEGIGVGAKYVSGRIVRALARRLRWLEHCPDIPDCRFNQGTYKGQAINI